VKKYDIGFKPAFDLAVRNVNLLETEMVPVIRAVDRIPAVDLSARVDSPSVDVSIKDGYAVISRDLSKAEPDSPVKLKVVGSLAAGEQADRTVTAGKAIRILSGAPIPRGADAVLAEEFTEAVQRNIHARAVAEKGRNILVRGADVKKGETLVRTGQKLTPAMISLLVAGGISEVSVFRRPRVGLLATGSEVLLPGKSLKKGKLFASNLALQNAWFTSLGMETNILVAKDTAKEISRRVETLLAISDVLVTSGGAWKGDRDLTIKVLSGLGAEILFHRVRMGPGKAVGMARLNGKPVFCLPGGPTSNEMAFIMIALPAILKMAGYNRSPYPYLTGKLEKEIRGQPDWTQFIQCQVILNGSEMLLRPMKMKSRLDSMSRTQAIVQIPEGVEKIPADSVVPYLCMDPGLFSPPLP
jgi:molybdopterin molybdotransferase